MFPVWLGWRLAFGVGAVLGLVILFVRRHVPESPRWLFIHGREDEAERIVGGIEREVVEETDQELPEPEGSLTVRQRERIPFRTIARTAFAVYPKRAVLDLALFIGQAFIHNGITFNLGTLFSGFYGVASGIVPMFLIIYAVGNLLGPVTLGRLFDSVGRKPMIIATYPGSAALSLPLAAVFYYRFGGEWTFVAVLVVTSYLASAGSSAAYLTVSEIFPMETRALAIAFFYAVGTGIGGVAGPLLFGRFIDSGVRGLVALGFLIAAAVMAIGGIAEIFFGVRAERTGLEDVAKPLTADEAESDQPDQPDQPDQGESDEMETSAEAVRLRQEAEQVRAEAAEHRATAARLRAGVDGDGTGGDGAAGHGRSVDERGRTEEILAEIGDLRAEALAERQRARGPRRAGGRAARRAEPGRCGASGSRRGASARRGRARARR